MLLGVTVSDVKITFYICTDLLFSIPALEVFKIQNTSSQPHLDSANMSKSRIFILRQ